MFGKALIHHRRPNMLGSCLLLPEGTSSKKRHADRLEIPRSGHHLKRYRILVVRTQGRIALSLPKVAPVPSERRRRSRTHGFDAGHRA